VIPAGNWNRAVPLRRAGAKILEVHLMRKLIIATTALAFLAATPFSAAFAQDKAGSTMSKGDDMSKDKMSKKTTKKTAKKSTKMKSDDATK
jgi:pentapeptide MXKDX repeat protein